MKLEQAGVGEVRNGRAVSSNSERREPGRGSEASAGPRRWPRYEELEYISWGWLAWQFMLHEQT